MYNFHVEFIEKNISFVVAILEYSLIPFIASNSLNEFNQILFWPDFFLVIVKVRKS